MIIVKSIESVTFLCVMAMEHTVVIQVLWCKAASEVSFYSPESWKTPFGGGIWQRDGLVQSQQDMQLTKHSLKFPFFIMSMTVAIDVTSLSSGSTSATYLDSMFSSHSVAQPGRSIEESIR